MRPELLYPFLLSVAGICISIAWAVFDVWRERLYIASATGSVERLEVLLKQRPSQDKVLRALFAAIFHRQNRSLIVLLDQDVDLNELIEWGGTPLHIAARCGTPYAIEQLVKRSDSLNRNEHGTPLFWAANQGNIANVELLLTHGADPKQVDIERLGKSGFVPCRTGNYPTIAKLLMEANKTLARSR